MEWLSASCFFKCMKYPPSDNDRELYVISKEGEKKILEIPEKRQQTEKLFGKSRGSFCRDTLLSINQKLGETDTDNLI